VRRPWLRLRLWGWWWVLWRDACATTPEVEAPVTTLARLGSCRAWRVISDAIAAMSLTHQAPARRVAL
jgi:hypothetical protein